MGIEKSASWVPFIGAWKLVSHEVAPPSGAATRPYGDHPLGLIIYSWDGRMSAQLMDPDPPAFEDADPAKAETAEAQRTWRSYVGYWGSFQVNEEAAATDRRTGRGRYDLAHHGRFLRAAAGAFGRPGLDHEGQEEDQTGYAVD